ncbi:hypothetical protein EBQ74_07720 [bacterium]|nr:hypothetical protein [bacterium]
MCRRLAKSRFFSAFPTSDSAVAAGAPGETFSAGATGVEAFSTGAGIPSFASIIEQVMNTAAITQAMNLKIIFFSLVNEQKNKSTSIKFTGALVLSLATKMKQAGN